MAKKLWLITAVCVSVAVVATGCTAPFQQAGTLPVGAHAINPCTTQALIQCTSAASTGHVAAPPVGTAHNKLAIILNDTAAPPLGTNKLSNILLNDGFHLIALRYLNANGVRESCPDANALSDPDCHRRFRHEVNFGAGVADPLGVVRDLAGPVNVSLENSTENRILQLVQYLVTNFPTEGWEQFQLSSGGVCLLPNPTYGACNLNWTKIVLVGVGLGAGHALYLSKFFPLDRLDMIAGPFDEYLTPTLTVAPWITDGGFVTPAASMYGFTHLRDPNLPNHSAAWTSLGVPGPQTTIDGAFPPYGGSHQLTTDAAPGCQFSTSFHESAAQDACTPGTSFPTFAAAWQYLAAG